MTKKPCGILSLNASKRGSYTIGKNTKMKIGDPGEEIVLECKAAEFTLPDSVSGYFGDISAEEFEESLYKFYEIDPLAQEQVEKLKNALDQWTEKHKEELKKKLAEEIRSMMKTKQRTTRLIRGE